MKKVQGNWLNNFYLLKFVIYVRSFHFCGFKTLSMSWISAFCLCLCRFQLVDTRWFKYDRDYLCVNKSQFVPVIFEPPCT